MKEHFEIIRDPRQTSKVMHNMVEIIVMAVCAVIAGCDVWEDIADFCRVKEDLAVLKNMNDKMSVARRRRHCAYDDDYLASVILSIHALAVAAGIQSLTK